MYENCILNPKPISDWKVMYENSPREMVKMFGLDWSVYGDLILGGEAAMWSEQVRTGFKNAKIKNLRLIFKSYLS